MMTTRILILLGISALVVVVGTACYPASTQTVEPTLLPISQGDLPGKTTPTLLSTAFSSVTLPAPTSIPSVSPISSKASFPDPAEYQWTLIAAGLNRPVDLVSANGDTGLLYVVEQSGRVRIIQDGKLLPDPFLDIRDRVGSNGNEQGLLGIAFHPKYAANGFFYLDYTNLDGDTVIARFSSPPGEKKIDPSSEFILIKIQQPFANHNGGNLIFGPDGYLWIGMGDGGGQGDPGNNGQSRQTLLGKMLRIDVDHGDPYTIPADNPFANGGGLPEIWAVGLRNPWRFSFDRLTGDLYIGDVGQNAWEEIDYLPAGFKTTPGNFGWNILEGTHPYKDASTTDNTGLTDPIFEYGRDFGCSVTGGFVYRGDKLPEFQGIYLFGDYCSGNIMGLIHKDGDSWESRVLFKTPHNISSFGEGQNGDTYLLDLNGGAYRLERK